MADPIAHPLGNLNVPSPEEYRKRKVALISGMCEGLWSVVVLIMCCFRHYWAGWVVFVGLSLSTRCVEKGVVDACYRTELLLEKGYEVHGIIRRSSSFNTGRLHHLYEDQHERMLAISIVMRGENTSDN